MKNCVCLTLRRTFAPAVLFCIGFVSFAVGISGQTTPRTVAVINKQQLYDIEKGLPSIVTAHKELKAAIAREEKELEKKIDALLLEMRGQRDHPKSQEYSRLFSQYFKMTDQPEAYFRSRWESALERIQQNIEGHLIDYMRFRKIDHVIDNSPNRYRTVFVLGQGAITQDFTEYLKRWESCARPCSAAANSVKPFQTATRLAYFDKKIAFNSKNGIKPLIEGYKDFDARSSVAEAAIRDVESRIKLVEEKMIKGDRTPAVSQELRRLKDEKEAKINVRNAISEAWSARVDAMYTKMLRDAVARGRSKGFDIIIDPANFKDDEAHIIAIARQNDLTAEVVANFTETAAANP